MTASQRWSWKANVERFTQPETVVRKPLPPKGAAGAQQGRTREMISMRFSSSPSDLLSQGEYMFSGARTFLSAAVFKGHRSSNRAGGWRVSACCGQECPRSALSTYQGLGYSAFSSCRRVMAVQGLN